MNRTAMLTVILSLAVASSAGAVTDEQKCQKSKLIALGKREACLQKEKSKEALGDTANTAKCETIFALALVKAGTACRWYDNGDGTATDLNDGLQWELKTDDSSVHDKDNTYTWNTAAGATPNGTAFTDFLGTLNNGVTGDGITVTGCFANHCDWRMPTLAELRSTLDAQYPDCASSPCTSIPGSTAGAFADFYWSSSTYVATNNAWSVSYYDGFLEVHGKTTSDHMRAVRGGS